MILRFYMIYTHFRTFGYYGWIDAILKAKHNDVKIQRFFKYIFLIPYYIWEKLIHRKKIKKMIVFIK